VSVGNPHCVIFITGDLTHYPVGQYGPIIEHSPLFPHRTNVEFVQVTDPHHSAVRVWERGSGETLACGSGASASVVAGILTHRLESPCSVSLPGGELSVAWQPGQGILLAGPAEKYIEARFPFSFLTNR